MLEATDSDPCLQFELRVQQRFAKPGNLSDTKTDTNFPA